MLGSVTEQKETQGERKLGVADSGDEVSHVRVSPNCPCLGCAPSRMDLKSEVESGMTVSLILFFKSSLSFISCVCVQVHTWRTEVPFWCFLGATYLVP